MIADDIQIGAYLSVLILNRSRFDQILVRVNTSKVLHVSSYITLNILLLRKILLIEPSALRPVADKKLTALGYMRLVSALKKLSTSVPDQVIL